VVVAVGDPVTVLWVATGQQTQCAESGLDEVTTADAASIAMVGKVVLVAGSELEYMVQSVFKRSGTGDWALLTRRLGDPGWHEAGVACLKLAP
jgi:hypothetical protein